MSLDEALELRYRQCLHGHAEGNGKDLNVQGESRRIKKTSIPQAAQNLKQIQTALAPTVRGCSSLNETHTLAQKYLIELLMWNASNVH